MPKFTNNKIMLADNKCDQRCLFVLLLFFVCKICLKSLTSILKFLIPDKLINRFNGKSGKLVEMTVISTETNNVY